jgi:predicted metal-dependent enzyme (double-stranded beta helix superfamily)
VTDAAGNEEEQVNFDIDTLVADCLDAVRGAGKHGGVAVEDVVARAVAQPSAIESAIGPPVDSPVFSTWFTSDELTVLHVVWPPHVELLAHDHRMWAAIGLYGGREDNQFFGVLPDGTLERRTSTTLRTGDTVVLGDDTVHAVANPSREWTGAIHVYGGNYFVPGRRMWPDGEDQPVEFDPRRVTEILDAAADRARHDPEA